MGDRQLNRQFLHKGKGQQDNKQGAEGTQEKDILPDLKHPSEVFLEEITFLIQQKIEGISETLC